jgi:chromosomal replication initiator protein
MQAWENFLTALESDLGAEVVTRWLKPLRIVRFDAGNLYLEAQDQFQALWFEEHVRRRATKEFVNNNQRRIKIHLTIADANNKTNVARSKTRKPIQNEKSFGSHAFTIQFDQLDPNSTFLNFVPSESNEVAYKLLLETCGIEPQQDRPTNALFNPIYLYGGKGTGKTHLLMSAADVLRKKGLNVIYSRAETFTEHVVNAIRAGEMSAFRQSYRNIDVLIIDDVHLFSRKGATQEELFHTFNTLHIAGKQIILSASCSPQELQLIEPRLVSRFEWGIVLMLEQLSKEHLEKMIHKKSESMRFPLNHKVVTFLTESFKSPKSLTRALEALVLRSHMNNPAQTFSSTSLTVAIAKHYLTDLLIEEEKQAITPQRIIQAVSESFGIRTDDFLGKSQNRESVLPRQLAMYLCRNNLKLPYMKIGDLFQRDHSTVMSSVKQIEKSVESGDQDILGYVSSISRKLQA